MNKDKIKKSVKKIRKETNKIEKQIKPKRAKAYGGPLVIMDNP